MQIRGIKGIGSFLKVLLQCCFVLGIVFLLGLYFIVKVLGIHFNLFIGCIYPCGIAFLSLIWQFIGLFDSLKLGNPFCEENILRMKYGMIASFIIAVFTGIALLLTVFVYSCYTLQLQVALGFITILFFGVGIALYILKELFSEAIVYKEENELTI